MGRGRILLIGVMLVVVEAAKHPLPNTDPAIKSLPRDLLTQDPYAPLPHTLHNNVLHHDPTTASSLHSSFPGFPSFHGARNPFTDFHDSPHHLDQFHGPPHHLDVFHRPPHHSDGFHAPPHHLDDFHAPPHHDLHHKPHSSLASHSSPHLLPDDIHHSPHFPFDFHDSPHDHQHSPHPHDFHLPPHIIAHDVHKGSHRPHIFDKVSHGPHDLHKVSHAPHDFHKFPHHKKGSLHSSHDLHKPRPHSKPYIYKPEHGVIEKIGAPHAVPHFPSLGYDLDPYFLDFPSFGYFDYETGPLSEGKGSHKFPHKTPSPPLFLAGRSLREASGSVEKPDSREVNPFIDHVVMEGDKKDSTSLDTENQKQNEIRKVLSRIPRTVPNSQMYISKPFMPSLPQPRDHY